ncbi:MAG TPA: hypothetical protein PLG66_18300, partial [Calditrichia bacterium]|nr:hypothetical protein [Calditrichia bacterium]
ASRFSLLASRFSLLAVRSNPAAIIQTKLFISEHLGRIILPETAGVFFSGLTEKGQDSVWPPEKRCIGFSPPGIC